MKTKLNKKEFEIFKGIIQGFVEDNFKAKSRDENAEIIPDDYKGSYEQALKRLWEDLYGEL